MIEAHFVPRNGEWYEGLIHIHFRCTMVSSENPSVVTRDSVDSSSSSEMDVVSRGWKRIGRQQLRGFLAYTLLKQLGQCCRLPSQTTRPVLLIEDWFTIYSMWFTCWYPMIDHGSALIRIALCAKSRLPPRLFGWHWPVITFAGAPQTWIRWHGRQHPSG